MRFFWLALALLMVGCQEKGEVIGEEITGYRGEARLNPYLAAEKYLNKQGYEAKSSRVWPENKDGLKMIVVPLSFIKTKGIAMRILEWVEEGGTLVVTMSGGEAGRNDFTSNESGGDGLFSIEEEDEEEATGEAFFLERLRVTTTFTDWSGLWAVDEVEADGHLRRPWHLSRLEEDYGGYQLEFEGEMGLFRNPYLARAGHAEFLEMLVDYGGSGSVVFLYGAGDSFFAMLWSRGWRFVVAGLVLLLLWLWMRIPRFGPVLADLEVTLNTEEVASSLQPILSKDPNILLKNVQRLQTLLKR